MQRVASFLEEVRAGRAPPEDVQAVLSEVLDNPRLALRFLLPESERYMLKDRVLDVAEFLAAAERVARGGSALDP